MTAKHRTIDIIIDAEAYSALRKINDSPELLKRFKTLTPGLVLFDSHVEFEQGLNAADRTSNKRIVLKPSKALLEFVATVPG